MNPKTMNKQVCESCRFLVELEKEFKVCRRYPPQLFSVNDQAITVYPVISKAKEWWCGEWQHKFSEGAN